MSPGPAEEVGVRRDDCGGLKLQQHQGGGQHQHQGGGQHQHQGGGQGQGGSSDRGRMRVDQRTDAQQALLGE